MPANVIARKTLLKRYDSAFRGLAMPPLVLINRHSLRKLLKLAPQLNFASRANLQTKAARTLAEFPYQALKKAGAKITINTDNRTVSNTTLTQEYQRYQQAFGTTAADF